MKGLIFVAAAVLSFSVHGQSQVIPLTHATTLAGQAVTLPADFHAGSTVLVVGFSQKSAKICSAWGQRIAAMTKGQGDVVSLQVPVLESVPYAIRGFVLRGMKHNVPAPLQATFIPVFEKETEWKQAVAYNTPDDAYVLVTDRKGQIVWKTHGDVTDRQLQSLKEHLSINPH